jgi:hypothetical protein
LVMAKEWVIGALVGAVAPYSVSREVMLTAASGKLVECQTKNFLNPCCRPLRVNST